MTAVPEQKPLLQILRECTRWEDQQIADLIGIPKGSVHSIRSGRTPERLDPLQVQVILEELRGFIEDAQEGLAEIEMRS